MYGKYKTRDEIFAMMAPPSHQVSKVQQFLSEHGLRHELVAGDYIRITGTAAQVNTAFRTELMLWSHHGMKKSVWRSVQPYSLPMHLDGYVDFVAGIHHFPTVHRLRTEVGDAALIGPVDLRTRYNVTDKFTNKANSTQAVAEFQGQY